MTVGRGRRARAVNDLQRPPRGSQDSAVGLDQAALEGLPPDNRGGRRPAAAAGDLRADNLASPAWSGNPAHLRSAARRLGAS
jgi:hypothetical protein